MLQTLHSFMNTGKPIYGMNCGTIGFLMNDLEEDDLPARIAAASRSEIHPLRMEASDAAGKMYTAYAINEVSLLRQSYQAAKLTIAIHGPILPIYAPLLALTPISAFRPRTWRGALLPDRVTVKITALEADKRPINAVADNVEFKSVVDVTVRQDRASSSTILFDPDHSWDERILAEQFKY
jgi:NAD+ kinase